jgi:hypothetical protein
LLFTPLIHYYSQYNPRAIDAFSSYWHGFKCSLVVDVGFLFSRPSWNRHSISSFFRIGGIVSFASLTQTNDLLQGEILRHGNQHHKAKAGNKLLCSGSCTPVYFTHIIFPVTEVKLRRSQTAQKRGSLSGLPWMIVKTIFSLPPREKMGQTHQSGD